jgi:hypothetical protein
VTIEGNVRSTAGNPIPGAAIGATSNTGGGASVTADGNGNYALSFGAGYGTATVTVCLAAASAYSGVCQNVVVETCQNPVATADFSVTVSQGPGIVAATAFVVALYRQVLGRTPSPAEDQGWVQSVAAGANRTQIAAGFLGSLEYQDDLVQSYYQRYLNRTANATEVAGWESHLQQGYTNEQVQDGFLSSSEFYADSGNSNSGFVTALYQKLLSRTPAPAEVQGWVNALNAGVSRAQVALGFLYSGEYRADLIVSFYQKYLSRTPAQAEISGWVAVLANGASDETVQADFLGSSEFWHDVTGL